jgi:NAD-dependent SIR2 family protein deacetylase
MLDITGAYLYLRLKVMEHNDIGPVINRLRSGRREGRSPLFVLGAGISFKRVPLLSDIGGWFADQLADQSQVTIPKDSVWTRNTAEKLSTGDATRREAAEFFSLMQYNADPWSSLWDRFSVQFLSEGFTVKAWKKRFLGISSNGVIPSPAHKILACALREQTANVVSLNFDGLTHRALTSDNKRPGIVLHSVDEISRYYCASTDEFVPSIIKIRGDVFYALCAGEYCPVHKRPHPLDWLRKFPDQDIMRCPSCGVSNLKLQFSFPGYRSKEEIAAPMLSAVRQFVGYKTSAIILVGVSGRWDEYLLRFIFQLAQDRNLLVVDVKPEGRDDLLIENYRSVYFPSVSSDTPSGSDASFLRIKLPADAFMRGIRESLT